MGFSCTEDSFTSGLAECGSGCLFTLRLSMHPCPWFPSLPIHGLHSALLPCCDLSALAGQAMVEICSRLEVGVTHSHVQSVADCTGDL